SLGLQLGYQLTDNLKFGPSATIGISPYGGAYGGISAGISTALTKATGISAGVGLDINSSGNLRAGMGAGISAGNVSLLGVGASLSSGSIRGSGSVGGFSADVHNSKVNNISTRSENVGLNVPILPISLSRSYVRYWIDENDAT